MLKSNCSVSSVFEFAIFWVANCKVRISGIQKENLTYLKFISMSLVAVDCNCNYLNYELQYVGITPFIKRSIEIIENA